MLSPTPGRYFPEMAHVSCLVSAPLVNPDTPQPAGCVGQPQKRVRIGLDHIAGLTLLSLRIEQTVPFQNLNIFHFMFRNIALGLTCYLGKSAYVTCYV